MLRLVLRAQPRSFNLQSAPGVTGPFTNLRAATSPYTNPTPPRNNSSGLKGLIEPEWSFALRYLTQT